MVDQDELGEATARALVDEAHRLGLTVVGHSHLPDEIRLGLKIGIDNFEHTGLGDAPRYPDDIMLAIEARAAEGRVRGSPYRGVVVDRQGSIRNSAARCPNPFQAADSQSADSRAASGLTDPVLAARGGTVVAT